MYTLDTNAIIYFVKDDQAAVSMLQEILSSEGAIYISTISEIELFAYPDEEECIRIREVMNTISIVPLDSIIVQRAAFLRRIYKLPLADSDPDPIN